MTLHRAEMAADDPVTVKRHQVDGTQIDVECPPLLSDYQAFGVDRSDQMIGFYNIGRSSKKWWKRVFSHIIECAILNARVLHPPIGTRPLWKKEARLHIFLIAVGRRTNR